MNKEINVDETPSSIYLMHKYWGKKPSNELRSIVKKYTKKGELILDPFAGYGGIGIESVLLGRNVILNDLNPIANFISKCILDVEVDIKMIQNYFERINKEYKEFEDEWYTYNNKKIITILRNNKDEPLKIKINDSTTKKMIEIDLTEKEKKEFINKENKYQITDWYPEDLLIPNSRISSKKNMKVSDLFSKRELICHSYLYKLIMSLPDTSEKELLKFAFTSNLANCSKLVPPIKSRGEMSQGAWMTGFYIGEHYLENNVFHYFENRVNKMLKGKKDYLKLCKNKKEIGTYQVTNYDAKNLKIENNTIDFIFTDFPYGDTVPYFEQSQIWNSWLKNDVDYKNEIVISDSNIRNKGKKEFQLDIEKSIDEIRRVLKENAYFIFTFHSLSGDEWEAISNALVKNDFEFIDCKMLLQKTFTPRQLNRKITIKGDMLVVYKKIENKQMKLNLEDVEKNIIEEIKKECKMNELYDTNDLIMICVKCLLKYNQISNKIDFITMINKYFEIDKNNDSKWRLKNEL